MIMNPLSKVLPKLCIDVYRFPFTDSCVKDQNFQNPELFKIKSCSMPTISAISILKLDKLKINQRSY